MSEAPLSGAQFVRQVGTAPEKWAARFLAVYAEAEGVRTDADRLAFVASWFKDAMDAAAKATRSEYDDLMKTGIWKVSARAGYGDKPSD